MNGSFLYAEDMIVVDTLVYAICRDMAFIYVFDMISERVIDLITLPDEDVFLKQSSRRLLKYEKNIVVVPYNAKYVYVYDLERNKWIKKIECCDSKIEGKYIEAFLLDNKIFLIGAFAKNIVIINTDQWTVEEIPGVFDRFENVKDLFCRNCHVLIGEKIFIPIAVANNVLIIDSNSYEYKYVEVGNEKTGFSGITFDENYFWLTPRKDGALLKVDKDFNAKNIKLPFVLEQNQCNFGGVYFINGRVILQGFEGVYSAEVNVYNEEISFDTSQYFFYKVLPDNRIICQLKNGNVKLVSMCEEKVFRIFIDMGNYNELIKKGIEDSVIKGELLYENQYYGLKQLLMFCKE